MALLGGLITAIAKTTAAGTTAKAAAGLGIAAAAVTGAGTAGVLPDPVQDTVAGAVASVTPFELPTTEDGTAPAPVGDDPPPVEAPEVEAPEVEAPAVAAPEPAILPVESPSDVPEVRAPEDRPRGLENAIAHADEHAQAVLQENLARREQHEADKAAREAARTQRPAVEGPAVEEPAVGRTAPAHEGDAGRASGTGQGSGRGN